MTLARRKPPKMGLRDEAREFPGHEAWVRRHVCAVPGCPSQRIEAHHLRKHIPPHEAGGIGIKPHSKWCIPLCREHHQECHDLGHDTFDAKHGISQYDIAVECQRASPHKRRWENEA